MCSFTYLPRQDSANGRISDFVWFLSNSPDAPDADADPPFVGHADVGSATQTFDLPAGATGRYLTLRALSEQQGQQFTTVADLTVDARAIEDGSPTNPPVPTEPPIPTEPPAPPVVKPPSSGGTGAGELPPSATNSRTLAATGSDTAAAGLLGILLLAAGGSVAVGVLRRRQGTDANRRSEPAEASAGAR